MSSQEKSFGNHKLTIGVWISLLVLGVFTANAFAQAERPGSVSDDQVNAVARQLYCPVCENIPLDVCPTQACAEWREMIREKLAEGWNEIQVKNYFVNQYGDRVLGAPPPRGLNWLVYVIPPLVILLGAIFLLRSMVLWQARSKQALKSASAHTQVGGTAVQAQNATLNQDDGYIEKFEEELKKR